VVERGESEPIATTAVDDDTATEQGVEATKTGNDNEAAVATGNTDCPVEKEDNSATKTIVGTKLESMAENDSGIGGGGSSGRSDNVVFGNKRRLVG